MKAFSVRELKNNPSVALRAAREHPVIVLNRNQPEAVLIHLDDESLLSEPGSAVRTGYSFVPRPQPVTWASGTVLGTRDGCIHPASFEAWHPGGTRKRRYHK